MRWELPTDEPIPAVLTTEGQGDGGRWEDEGGTDGVEDLSDEGIYGRYRADQLRWQLQQGRLSRRQLLQLSGAASAALTLGGR